MSSWATSGCLEWLEVPGDGSGDVREARPTVSASLPQAPPRADAPGPLVPATPGLRVPDGYWVRVRLDVADLVLPHAWASFVETADGVVLRLVATGDDEVEGVAAPTPTLRAVIPLSGPEGLGRGGASAPLSGFTLGPEALAEGIVGLRTTAKTSWTVRPERLVLDEVGEHVIKGTLEGAARRGSRSPQSRPVRVAFVALRAP